MSSSGIYHIMLQAHDDRQIFYDDHDRDDFLRVLAKVREVSEFELYAYCLMGNHIHLLLRPGKESVSTIFRRFGASFVYHYNLKYHRVGHLFRDRYRSEPVENDAYFLTCLRYILHNPVKAGLCERPDAYPYSSAAEYMRGEKGITDTAFASGLFPSGGLTAFLSEEHSDHCLDISENPPQRLSDEEAVDLIKKEFGTVAPAVPVVTERRDFNRSVKKLFHAGISVRQISRLTGISKAIVELGIRND